MWGVNRFQLQTSLHVSVYMSVGLCACLGVVRLGCNQIIHLFTPPPKKKSIIDKTYKVRDYVVVKYEGYTIERGR